MNLFGNRIVNSGVTPVPDEVDEQFPVTEAPVGPLEEDRRGVTAMKTVQIGREFLVLITFNYGCIARVQPGPQR